MKTIGTHKIIDENRIISIDEFFKYKESEEGIKELCIKYKLTRDELDIYFRKNINKFI